MVSKAQATAAKATAAKSRAKSPARAADLEKQKVPSESIDCAVDKQVAEMALAALAETQPDQTLALANAGSAAQGTSGLVLPPPIAASKEAGSAASVDSAAPPAPGVGSAAPAAPASEGGSDIAISFRCVTCTKLFPSMSLMTPAGHGLRCKVCNCTKGRLYRLLKNPNCEALAAEWGVMDQDKKSDFIVRNSDAFGPALKLRLEQTLEETREEKTQHKFKGGGVWKDYTEMVAHFKDKPQSQFDAAIKNCEKWEDPDQECTLWLLKTYETQVELSTQQTSTKRRTLESSGSVTTGGPTTKKPRTVKGADGTPALPDTTKTAPKVAALTSKNVETLKKMSEGFDKSMLELNTFYTEAFDGALAEHIPKMTKTKADVAAAEAKAASASILCAIETGNGSFKALCLELKTAKGKVISAKDSLEVMIAEAKEAVQKETVS